MKVKKTKRFLSVLLALMIIISAVPLSSISVFAAESEDFEYQVSEDSITHNNEFAIAKDKAHEYNVQKNNTRKESGNFEYEILEDGTAEIKGYNGTASDLVIPSEIDGYKVTNIGIYAFEGCESLTNIMIPESVTSIGNFVFEHCTSLKSIIVDSKNTNYSDIDGVLFNKAQTELIRYPEAKKDTDYTIPYGVTTIKAYAFYLCTFPTNIIIPDTVTNIKDGAFYGCTSLTNITIPDSVTNIEESAFRDCKSLTDVTISYGITTIEDLTFLNCSSLTNIEMPNSVTVIGYSAFLNCTSLTDIIIPCRITSIEEGAFSNCTSLTNITIPDSVTSIGFAAFSNCTSLQNITIPYSVTEIGNYAFECCNSLKNITVDPKNAAYSDIDGVLFNKEQTELIRYPEAKTDTNYTIPYSVTNIGDYAFKGCIFIKDIEIHNSVINIGTNTFENCTSLISVVIPESVSNIGYFAFGYIDIPATGEEPVPGFKIYGYAGTAAETYAKENGFDFIGLDKKVDSATGISVAEKELNIIPDGSEIKTALLSAEDNRIVFDISLIKDGSEVQPNGEVTIKIPVPEGMDGSLLKVYREEADGSLTDMNAYFADGSMIFTTDHFSKYIITAEESVSVLKGDVNGDGTVDAADAVLVQRYDAGMINLSKTQLKAADVNSDGTVDAADAVLIMRFDAGLIDRL